MPTQTVPQSLKRWFLVHFIADFIFALPLMFAPVFTMQLFGWSEINELTVRLTGAALIGIGGQSLLSRDDTKEAFISLLSMKLIWSSAAILGIVLTIFSGNQPPIIWGFLVTFVSFNFLWGYYYRVLKRGA
ncbi:MAG: hypothetical protein OCD01_13530 [Fibrobacterales bacterium]